MIEVTEITKGERNFMKKTKIAIVGITAIMALTGCRGKVTPASLLKDAAEMSSKAESVEMTMNMEMDAKISMTGVSVDLGMDMDLDADVTYDPILMQADGKMSVKSPDGDQSIDMQMYAEADGKDLIIYAKTVDGEWSKMELEGLADLTSVAMTSDNSAVMESLELAKDTETINRIECYKISGSIKGEDMEGFAESMEDNEMLKDIDLKDVEIPIEYYIAKADKYPVRITVDMTSMMDDMATSMMKVAMGSGAMGAELDSLKLSIETCTFAVDYTDFGKVDKIEIPSEAKDAKEASAAVMEEPAEDEVTAQEIGDIFQKNKEDNDAQTEAETKAAETKAEAEAPAQTGQGWRGFSFSSNGKTLTMPCSLDDVLAAGLEIEDGDYNEIDENYIINAGEYKYLYMNAGENFKGSLNLYLVNETSEPKKAFECSVAGIDYSCYSDAYKMEIDLVFQDGIKIGDPIENAIAAYGEPTDTRAGDDYTYYEWADEENYYCSCEIRADEDGNIVNYEMKNFNLK